MDFQLILIDKIVNANMKKTLNREGHEENTKMHKSLFFTFVHLCENFVAFVFQSLLEQAVFNCISTVVSKTESML